jgi:hypothetical protein
VIRDLHRRAQRLKQTLWALIVPPTVWALHFLFSYVYAAIRCAKAGELETITDVRIAIGAATLLALVIIAASAFVAWAQAGVEGDPPPHQESTDEDRLRFLATATLLLSGLSFAATLFTAIPAFIFPDCR